MFSLFHYDNHLINIPIPTHYVSYYDWSNEGKMNKVLLELSKVYPQTRELYDKYTQKEFGWINNRLNKHYIIHHYIKMTKLNRTKMNNIKSIIDNYEKNAIKLDQQYSNTNELDRKILTHILNKYLYMNINNYVNNILKDIIKSLQDNKINVDSYEIYTLLETNCVQIYNTRIINDIKYYRNYQII